MIGKIKIPRNELNLEYTLRGGQAFRWKENITGYWTGVFAHRVWTLWQDEDHLCYKVLHNDTTTQVQHDSLLRRYFRLDENLSNLYKQWSSCDEHFLKAAKKFNGVRMLDQDPVEIIFTFICSSNNTIHRITSMIEKLCRLYGNEIGELENVKYYDFPTIDKLAHPSVEGQLKQSAFGYRCKFIQQSAKKIMEFGGEIWIENLKNMAYVDAKKELMKLTGVGAKVADCICLMSLNHLQAIPVDTHVYQMACRYYLPHLKTKTVTDRVYKEIGDHFRSIYGDYAGWPHCVLFCDELKAFQNASKDTDNTHEKQKATKRKRGKKC